MKNKIIQKLKGSDKLLHSMVGNTIFVVAFITAYLLYSLWAALAMAIGVVLLVGIAKELYDKYIKRTFIDWWDIVASLTPYPLIKHIQKL
ncbi:hypothetical protein [Capnocytophaga sputigena]|jgi:hypothetical protein|uniref:Uncharacterized protein n=1 Tax=Capnocytophaga sputigena TaxID=1019 RepID=A0AAX2I944_CAPSP|nr:hypothetical protein [Capnocytophaga sputigena]ATA83542.1 hypothetical protein CGC55_02995 [Capnocytophaga sputigena]ATA85514.1 hypothetical protein CGC55_13855 [Capnocytophaga sputigena]EEB64746.1 hypothetical protein CAPSP0001_2414 [Capnocytophaga sputigena ATCC 33612]SQA74510.1 Uncharacterised protein [Capnocytophaga sputigena]